MKTVLKVNGMSCSHCVSAIEGALARIGATAKVDLSSRTVTVEYDEQRTSLARIKEEIDDQGYEVIE